jgi:hypothetical protein
MSRLPKLRQAAAGSITAETNFGRSPEGRDEEQHWPGPVSDVLDDGEYKLSIVEQGQTCTVRLEGPADTRTGLQYSARSVSTVTLRKFVFTL